jgi:hypothetical protein
VLDEQAVGPLQGGFSGTLETLDEFGTALASLGDLDGDGVVDLAVGAWGDDDGGPDHGAVWSLFLNADGTVRSHAKISETSGGFGAALDDFDRFGHSLARLGDLDGDGVTELAVGAVFDDDGGVNQGAVYVLFMARDGTVSSHAKISATSGGFLGDLDPGDLFGHSVAPLGDHDGDGVPDLAVGSDGDDDGGSSGAASATGAFWVLHLLPDGSVKDEHKVSATAGGFGGALDDGDGFGHTLVSLGDLDGDGVVDLAVGAPGDEDGGGPGDQLGAVWIVFLAPDATVKAQAKISATSGGFGGALEGDRFSESMAALGDLDGDGVVDLAVGEFLDDDGGPPGPDSNLGAEWILFLDDDGSVKSHVKISATSGGFGGLLVPGDLFGHSSAGLGDLDGDGRLDLAVGAPGSLGNAGALWVLFLNAAVWSELGAGLAGSQGVPALAGSGTLRPGEPVALGLTGAAALAPTTLVLGDALELAPFKGGLLVPQPDLLLSGLFTDASGSLVLAGAWPTGLPPHSELYLQCWLVDPAGPAGLAASNGLLAVTP